MSFLKKIFKTFLWFLVIILVLLVGLWAFSYRYYTLGYESVAIDTKTQVFQGMGYDDIITTDSGSVRRTSNTFMSIPEWYIVSISDDYTIWLETGRNPSDFPYWQYLKDYWSMYGKITAIMDDKIPRDHEYHTMVRVIWLSTTLEFWVKSLYENTIGRLSYLGGFWVEEERYYAKVSREYVDFILLRPWYEYNFASAIVWHQHSSFSLRSLERYYFYLIEFYLKKYYAGIIETAAHSQFAIPNVWTHVNGTFPSSIHAIDPKNIEMTASWIQISRYYPFTEIFPKISSYTGSIVEDIAGNKKVVTEFLIDTGAAIQKELFTVPIPIDSSKSRAFFYLSPAEVQSYLNNPSMTLTHIYDF